MAYRGPVSRRSRRRSCGRSARSQHLLFRLDRRRRVEDDGWRPVLGEHDRQILQARVRRCDRGRAGRPERDLRGHGRELHPRQRIARRRCVPLDRCRPDVDAPRSRGHAQHRQGPRSPRRSRHRVRRCARSRARPERRAWRLPDARRRQDLEEGSVPKRQGRCVGPLDRSE